MSDTTNVRNFVHVPFDRMECPADDCTVEGTVPGIKRHATRMHPGLTYDFPPNRTGVNAALEAKLREEGTPIENLKVDELRVLAEAEGVESAGTMRKDDLLAALDR